MSAQNGPLGSPVPETGFKPPFDCFARVESGLLQDLADISTGEDQNRVTVLDDLGVCLVVNARGGYENPELPVAQPGDKSSRIFHTRTASAFRIFALSLQSEIHEDVGGSSPDSVFSQPVATAVLPRSREIDAHNVRVHHFNEIACASFESIFPVRVRLEELDEHPEDRLLPLALGATERPWSERGKSALPQLAYRRRR